ncbi:MAG: hypothetical protein U1E10_04485 [Bdellovibrionales bacterium]|nr:hypothetical protein [Bdellovibrionales bacterium]
MNPNSLEKRGPTLTSVLSVVCLSVLSAVACTPPNKDAGTTAAGPTTDWKEGYGGDSIAIEVVRHIETICFRTRTMRKGILSSSLETDKDVAAEICGLLEPNALSVEPIEQPMVKGVAKDAANYPNARPRRLEVKRNYWTATATDIDKREALLLHEILPLIGLEDADYVRSTRMLLALEAKINRITIASCDEKRIEAIFAAGDPDFLKFYTKDFGANRCEQVINVLKKHVVAENFEDELKFDLQHYYMWGVFTDLVRAKTVPEMDKVSGTMRAAMVSLPDAFRDWSKDTCHSIAQIPEDRPRSCGSFLNVIAGASSRLEYMTAELSSRSYDDEFERAAIQVIGMIRTDQTWELSNNPLLRGEQVSSSIVQSAIEGQNWMTLYFLGRLQRRLNPELRASDVLLRDINFRAVQNKAPSAAITDGLYNPFVVPLNRCLPEEIRTHAASILDGTEVNRLFCGSHGSI